jgi:hypothetical protein
MGYETPGQAEHDRRVREQKAMSCAHGCSEVGRCLHPSDPACPITAPPGRPAGWAAPKYTTGVVRDALEQVDHPSHYGGDTTYETIKVIAAWGLGFLLGNAVKYISRAGKKDTAKLLEDLKKARWYLDKAIEKLERNEALF